MQTFSSKKSTNVEKWRLILDATGAGDMAILSYYSSAFPG